MKEGKGVNIVLGGRGGQGILFSTTVLERAAVNAGVDVIGSETHGMAQRGGSVVSHLKVGKAHGPLVASGEADILVSLDKTEAYRNLHFLRSGGTCFSSVTEGDEIDPKVASYLEETGIRLFHLDADSIARSLGSPQAANVALLGLLASWPDSPFSEAELTASLKNSGAERFREKNLEVFAEGCRAGKARYFSGA
jgi:indolepyruvate ferredoxin oxidoreductase beta subunit